MPDCQQSDVNMEIDLDRLIQELNSDPNIFAQAVELLTDIQRLDRNRMRNLGTLLNKHSSLISMLWHGPRELRMHHDLRHWTQDYAEELGAAEKEIQHTFGLDLEAALQQHGFALTGHYPLLKSGLFALELDFSRYQITLWYGPRQERLGRCPTVAGEAADKLKKFSEELGGEMGAEFFSGMLYSSYEHFTDKRMTGSVPLIVLVDRFVEVHKTARALAPKGERRSRLLGRPDFSYNLFRFSETLIKHGWQLRVASRSFTRRRRDFLWVPDSETGTGTYYSHIEMKE